jgi:hypothetical protein
MGEVAFLKLLSLKGQGSRGSDRFQRPPPARTRPPPDAALRQRRHGRQTARTRGENATSPPRDSRKYSVSRGSDRPPCGRGCGPAGKAACQELNLPRRGYLSS